MINEKNILVYVLFGVLALISWWLLKLAEPEQEVSEIVAQHSVDYYSLGYQKRTMNDLGLLSSEVKANKMSHYSDDGSIYLEAPVLSFFDEKLPPWVIEADRGILSNAGKDLFLSGPVLVSRAASKLNRAVQIKTSDLQVKPETSDAETNNKAELLSPPDSTTGVGLKLHFADPIRITLLKQVRGKYEIH